MFVLSVAFYVFIMLFTFDKHMHSHYSYSFYCNAVAVWSHAYTHTPQYRSRKTERVKYIKQCIYKFKNEQKTKRTETLVEDINTWCVEKKEEFRRENTNKERIFIHTFIHSMRKKQQCKYSTTLWIFFTLTHTHFRKRSCILHTTWSEFSIETETVNTQGNKIQLYCVDCCLTCQMKCNHRVWGVDVTMINNCLCGVHISKWLDSK